MSAAACLEACDMNSVRGLKVILVKYIVRGEEGERGRGEGDGHQKTHFRLPMATQGIHSLIETLRSHFNLTNPQFNRLIVSQFLDFWQLLRSNSFILTAIFENANE